MNIRKQHQLRDLVAAPCKRHGVRRLRLFGSQAREDSNQASDADFVVAFDNLNIADASHRYFGLLHDLEDALTLPVDLLTEDSIKKESLNAQIEADSVTLYET